MNHKELKRHASSCQMAADEMAIELITVSALALFNPVCGFNLFYAYGLSPEFLIHVDSIELLLTGIESFTRKITMKELWEYDFIIRHHELKTFSQFVEILKN